MKIFSNGLLCQWGCSDFYEVIFPITFEVVANITCQNYSKSNSIYASAFYSQYIIVRPTTTTGFVITLTDSLEGLNHIYYFALGIS